MSLYSDERASAEMYYKLLNCGFRIAATGGTDNFPDVWRDPPPGTDRTYAKVEGRLTVASWLAEASVSALNAGVDLILISYDPDLFYPAMHALLRADQAGLLRKDMLDRSDRRLA